MCCLTMRRFNPPKLRSGRSRRMTAGPRLRPSLRRSDRKAGAAAARCGGIGIVDAKRGADQIVDKVEFRSREERLGCRVDQNHRIVALDDEVVIGPRVVDIELVLKARATAALDRNPQHRTGAFAFEDLPNPACSAVADGYVSRHRSTPIVG